MTISVDDILSGTFAGERQTVGNMEVIPLIGEDDDTFAPPDFEVSTRNYGEVHVRNTQDRPVIIPPGSAWMVDQAAQDHAVGGGKIVKAGVSQTLKNACCIQETQGGLIRKGEHKLTILPVAMRTHALSNRTTGDYSRLWGSVRSFKQSMGMSGSGNLVDFVSQFEKQLDEFVAEFELVPKQVGAAILINGKLVGVERAPSKEFWEFMWEPLVRVCYGSLAIREQVNVKKAIYRATLGDADSIAALVEAVEEANKQDTEVTTKALTKLKAEKLKDTLDQNEGLASLTTVANQRLAGQIVSTNNGVLFASLCAAKV
jgi:hypothetical protein